MHGVTTIYSLTVTCNPEICQKLNCPANEEYVWVLWKVPRVIRAIGISQAEPLQAVTEKGDNESGYP